MTVARGWYPDKQHPGWSRWWDGEQWRDAYWQTSQPNNRYLPDAPRFDVGSGRGWYSFDLVGENFREEAIARAIGGRPPRDQEVEWHGVAELVPEPDNPHGGGEAISARVDGTVVAYFDQAQAREYFPVLGRMVASGVVPVAPIRIWAVTRYSQARRRDELKSAVRLDIRAADEILPANQAPSASHALIPRGRAVQVTGEADHLDAIAPHIAASGMLVATLHPLQVTKGKTTTTVLEVRLDDRRVGQLTPATSASLLPLVQEAERKGLVAAAWASVKGSKFAAEVSLHVSKAEEVTDHWPSSSDALPTLTTQRQVPPAFQREIALQPAPKGGLPRWQIWVGVVTILIVTTIPGAGPILALLLVTGLAYRALRQRKQAPRSVLQSPVAT